MPVHYVYYIPLVDIIQVVKPAARAADQLRNPPQRSIRLTAMNDIQEKLLELKDRGWTMAAIADELGVSHMAVFRWQKGMRKAENSRSVLHMLDTLMKRKRIPKRRRRGSSSSLRNASTVNRKSD